MPNNKILIVLGMHRSGTSLMANWLNKCRLNMGDKLLRASPTNKHGHFEDLDFLHFHNDILISQNLSYVYYGQQELKLSEYDYLKAKNLTSFKSSLRSQWGWKEPRTCLFLPLWKEILPDAYYLIIYRDYQLVIDSLLRRELSWKLFSTHSLLKKTYNLYVKMKHQKRINVKANEYLKTWNFYNKQLLQNIDIGENFLYLNIDSFYKNEHTYRNLYNHLTNRWKFDLKFTFPEEIFVEAEYNNTLYYYPKFKKSISIESKNIMNKLEQKSIF